MRIGAETWCSSMCLQQKYALRKSMRMMRETVMTQEEEEEREEEENRSGRGVVGLPGHFTSSVLQKESETPFMAHLNP